MNIEQLLYRLPHYELGLIECRYRGLHTLQYQELKDDGKIWKTLATLKIRRVDKDKKYYEWGNPIDFMIHVDETTGLVEKDYDVEPYFGDIEQLNVEELLKIFKAKCRKKYDFTELENCVYNHNCDLELRHRLLGFVALKLLYSPNTTPECGYERAKRFIEEFNKELNLTLSTNEIDEIMHRNYQKESYQERPFNRKKLNKTIGGIH